MVVAVVIFGFVFHWLFFNTRIETAEVKNLSHKERLPESFILEATFYTSQIVEDHSKKTIYSEGEVDPYDLCATQHITLVKSPYFDRAKDQEFTCQREQLSPYTDAYHVRLGLKDIPSGKIKDQTIRFDLNSEFNRAFHFIDWKFTSVWTWTNKVPEYFSAVSGSLAPQPTHSDNLQLGTAFKGPLTTHVNILLTPTFYTSDIDGSYSGYRTYFDQVERGSVVNARNMLQKYTPEGYENRGLDIEFVANVDKDIYVV